MKKMFWISGAAAAVWMAAAPSLFAQNPRDEKEKAKRGMYMVYPGERSFLGVGVAEVNAERAKALNVREERGVEITRVEDDSPAAKAGLKTGDVVLEYQGQRVEGVEQFVRLVRETPAGRLVKLLISRSGQTQTVTPTIEPRKMRTVEIGDMHISIPHIEVMPPQIRIPMPDIPRPVINWRSRALGVEAESVGSQLADFFGVKEGVLVRSVTKGSAADKAGVKAGDVITKVDDKKVTSPAEVTRAIRSQEGRRSFVLSLTREKREMSATVTIEEESPPATPRGRTIRQQEFEL
ncbi:MAG: PDZ domain-containing protein [Acidobacteria bacterium]|nr:PDZ domain-containing protein [Acidobacteriota bacterium]